jgi:nitroimidazol reductase NimA-like FMN-containing flavoprotein (pyridoxamine 5'-phosphate oxidase superfamily)
MTTGASKRTTVRRHPERAEYDRETIHPILDEALFCHVGFVEGEQPFVIPTIHARAGETLYLHGSPASRMLRELERGLDVCVTVTLLDGVVLARSVYNSSMNYRSVVVLGRARLVEDREEKLAALDAIVDHVAPGRALDARGPTEKELKGTKVLALPLADASAKVRTGPPDDFDHDLELAIWAGVVPVRLVAGAPETAPDLRMPVAVPGYASGYAWRLRTAENGEDGARPAS